MLSVVISCKNIDTSSESEDGSKLFTSLSSTEAGVNFINELQEDININYFQYNYTYIGGGGVLRLILIMMVL